MYSLPSLTLFPSSPSSSPSSFSPSSSSSSLSILFFLLLLHLPLPPLPLPPLPPPPPPLAAAETVYMVPKHKINLNVLLQVESRGRSLNLVSYNSGMMVCRLMLSHKSWYGNEYVTVLYNILYPVIKLNVCTLAMNYCAH